ncbi:MAG: phage holin family protein [Vulcanimicrobiaceae bacterium]
MIHEEDQLRDRSIGQLFSRLSREMSLLIQQEIDLAKAELMQKIVPAGTGVAFLLVAALFGLGAFAALTTAFITALMLVFPAWGASLIVMGVWGMLALILAAAAKGRIQSATPPAPQTVETLKENVEWAKTQATLVRK